MDGEGGKTDSKGERERKREGLYTTLSLNYSCISVQCTLLCTVSGFKISRKWLANCLLPSRNYNEMWVCTI